MTSVYKNIAGTISNFFRIGMKGPTISWSSSSPSGSGNPGDLCVITGASPKLLQRHGAEWQDVSRPSFVVATATASSYTCDGTEDLVLVNASPGVTITLSTGTPGKTLVVKDETGASNVSITVMSTNAQTIDGATSATISTKRGALRLLYGTEWHIV